MKREINNVKAISLRLRQVRQMRRLRQVDCARLINISLSHYNKLEQGIGGVSDGVMMAAAQALNVSFEWLCKGIGDGPTDGGPTVGRRRIRKSAIADVVKALAKPEIQALADRISEQLQIQRLTALRIAVRGLVR